jgi:hypothetical protein
MLYLKRFTLSRLVDELQHVSEISTDAQKKLCGVHPRVHITHCHCRSQELWNFWSCQCLPRAPSPTPCQKAVRRLPRTADVSESDGLIECLHD